MIIINTDAFTVGQHRSSNLTVDDGSGEREIHMDIDQRISMMELDEQHLEVLGDEETTRRRDPIEILKEIFVNKEEQLNVVEKKVDELTKELHQLKKCHVTNSDDRSDLGKWKEELRVNISIPPHPHRVIRSSI